VKNDLEFTPTLREIEKVFKPKTSAYSSSGYIR